MYAIRSYYEVNRRQHQGREAGLGRQVIDRLAGIGEQQVGAEGSQGMAGFRIAQAGQQEDPRSYNFV